MAANLMTPVLLEQVQANLPKREVLVDWFEDGVLGPFNILSEAAGDSKVLVVEGKVGEADKATANGRRYSRKILEREIARLQPRIQNRSLFASVDHPGDGKGRIRDTGAICTALRMEANGHVVARYEIIDGTSAGGDLAAVIRAGGLPGMSSRGIGSTRMTSEGVHDVQDDFKLYGYDFVADPACQTAYPKVVKEDVDANTATEADVRRDYPEVVAAIEAKSLQRAAQTVQEEADERYAVLEAEIASGVTTRLAEGRADLEETIKVELLREVRTEMAEDFSTKLLRALQKQESQVRAQVRSELLADPTVAGAKQTLERVCEMVGVFVNPANTSTNQAPVLGEKVETVGQAELEELRAKVSRLGEDLARTESYKTLAVDKARVYGYQLYVEQNCGTHPQVDEIKNALGDLSEFASISDLRGKLQEAIDNVDELRVRAQEEAFALGERDRRLSERKVNSANRTRDKALTENERIRELVRTEVGSLRDRFSTALTDRDRQIDEANARVSSLEKALLESDSERVSATLLAFAHRRTMGHPRHDDIIAMVESGRLKTGDEINEQAEAWDMQGAESGGAAENIRRSMGRGREAPTEEQRQRIEEILNPLSQSQQSRNPVPHLEGLGVDMTELKKLSGIGQTSGRRRF